MKYPLQLNPTSHVRIELPSNKIVEVPQVQTTFKVWSGKNNFDTYGGKTVLSVYGKPAFAELIILKIFQPEGWEGVWVDTFQNKYRTEYFPKNEVDIPVEQDTLIEAIRAKTGMSKGCWDVFCWKDNDIIFAESKRRGRDRIRNTQIQWLESSLEHGLSLDSFLVVEWSTT